MVKIKINYKRSYKFWGKMSHISINGGTYITSFEGIAAIKDSENTTKELIEYLKEYWKKRGYDVFCLSLDNGVEEGTEFSYNSNDDVVIQTEDNSFYAIMTMDIMDSFYNSNSKDEKDNDIFACYKTVTETGKDGMTIVTSYKESQCFKDEISATTFVENEIKHSIFEDFANTKRKSSYFFNPSNREWTYTKYSTEKGDLSLTRIEFTVEYIGKLHF